MRRRPGRLPGPARAPRRKNLPGWPAGPWTDVYYEASSTAEQQAYYAYGAFGFTPEATPGFSGDADVPPAVPERHRQLPRHRHALRRPDDARALLRRVQGGDRAAAALGDHAAPRRAGAKLTLTKTLHARHARPRSGRRGQPAAGPRVPERDQRRRITVPANGKFEWHVNPSLRPSQYTDQFIDESYTLDLHRAPTARCWRRRRSRSPAAQVVNRSLCTQGGVGGTVPGDARADARRAGDVRRVHARASRRSTTRARPPT